MHLWSSLWVLSLNSQFQGQKIVRLKSIIQFSKSGILWHHFVLFHYVIGIIVNDVVVAKKMERKFCHICSNNINVKYISYL